jgi:tetratricopeptide (TPR) repeat protein
VKTRTTFMLLVTLMMGMVAGGRPMFATAQEDGAPVSIGTYRVIESLALGETRRLLIHLPRGYEGSAVSYPVVYHTYGDYISPYYAEAYLALESLANEARIPPLILVGIDNIDRYRDLRPLAQDGSPAGIAAYTRFLTEEVFPFVEASCRTSPYRILAGPQAGAVFCLYTLIENTDLFDAFILNNPLVSPPSTDLLLGKAETFFASQQSLPKFFFITYGGLHETPELVAHVDRLWQFASPARDRGFQLLLNDIGGNDEFITPLCLKAALKALFAEYYVPPDTTFGGLAGILEHYRGVSERYGFDVSPAEHVMTRSVDTLLAQKEDAAAVEILEYQTGLYPNMLNGWWRLAGIAAGRGDTAGAIELYRKCVEIDPSVKNFVERRIEALQAGDAKTFR